MNYNKLKNILSEKNISIPQLAEKINSLQINSLPEKKAITRGGLYSTIKNETLTIEMLEYISTALGVPVTTFFETDSKSEECDLLKSELEELKKTNDRLMEVSQLKEKLAESASGEAAANYRIICMLYAELIMLKIEMFSFLQSKFIKENKDMPLEEIEDLIEKEKIFKEVSRLISYASPYIKKGDVKIEIHSITEVKE